MRPLIILFRLGVGIPLQANAYPDPTSGTRVSRNTMGFSKIARVIEPGSVESWKREVSTATTVAWAESVASGIGAVVGPNTIASIDTIAEAVIANFTPGVMDNLCDKYIANFGNSSTVIVDYLYRELLLSSRTYDNARSEKARHPVLSRSQEKGQS